MTIAVVSLPGTGCWKLPIFRLRGELKGYSGRCRGLERVGGHPDLAVDRSPVTVLVEPGFQPCGGASFCRYGEFEGLAGGRCQFEGWHLSNQRAAQDKVKTVKRPGVFRV